MLLWGLSTGAISAGHLVARGRPHRWFLSFTAPTSTSKNGSSSACACLIGWVHRLANVAERSQWWARHRIGSGALGRLLGHLSRFWPPASPIQANTAGQAMEFLLRPRGPNFCHGSSRQRRHAAAVLQRLWNSYHIDNRREQQRPPSQVAKSGAPSPASSSFSKATVTLEKPLANTSRHAGSPLCHHHCPSEPTVGSTLNPINSVERIMIYATEDALPCPMNHVPFRPQRFNFSRILPPTTTGIGLQSTARPTSNRCATLSSVCEQM